MHARLTRGGGGGDNSDAEAEDVFAVNVQEMRQGQAWQLRMKRAVADAAARKRESGWVADGGRRTRRARKESFTGSIDRS